MANVEPAGRSPRGSHELLTEKPPPMPSDTQVVPPGTVRLASAADAARCRAIYAPAITDLPTSFETEVPSVEEMACRIEALLERTPWLVWEDPELGVVGYAYGGTHRERAAYSWTVETTIYLDAAVHGRGVGRALYEALLRALEVQGFRLAVAGAVVPNDASTRLHLRVGFREVGVYHGIGWKSGRAHDVAWFERPFPAAPGPGQPAPIRPLPELRGDPAFLEALRVRR
jgi:L-amino acid N-acyltransferase YncA